LAASIAAICAGAYLGDELVVHCFVLEKDVYSKRLNNLSMSRLSASGIGAASGKLW
jgi:hypothetical protein